jgi:prepilin-type N-terminal cleavage/methylation domain-containing protein/prepilin-type processing-associated H-X9-DG protein
MTVQIKTRRSFTLVELLVCIGIISILAAMLMPTLANVKKQAQKTQCASQLRQCGLAMSLYADDWTGYYPHAYLYPYFGVEYRWAGLLVRQKYIDRMQEVACCPTDFSLSRGFITNFNTSTLGPQAVTYGFRAYLGGSAIWSWVRREKLAQPSATVVLLDATYYATWNSYNNWVHTSYTSKNALPTSITDRAAHFRHLGQANAWFVDNHVKGLDVMGLAQYGITGGWSADYSPCGY